MFTPLHVARQCIFMAILVLLPLVPVRADLLLEEGFDYTNGPLRTVSGGFWSTHSGTLDELQVSDGRAALKPSLSEDLNVPLPGGPYRTTTNISVYWSFRLIVTNLPTSATTDYFTHLNTTSHRCKVFISTNGASSGRFRLGVANAAASPSVFFPDEFPTYSEVIVLLKFTPASNVSTLWVNPESETNTSVIASDNAALEDIRQVALRQASRTGDLLVDDIRIGTSYMDVQASSNPTAPVITLQPQDQPAVEGQTITLNGLAAGTAPLTYQWFFNGAPLGGETNEALMLVAVSTNDSGFYSFVVTNGGGYAESDPAMVVVSPSPPWDGVLKVVTWNVKGNGLTNADDWGLGAPQVQAIGRVLNYLSPDIITFNEIPRAYTWQMTNWVAGFLPNWHLATNSGTDGYIRTVIASRFEILSSQSHLDGKSLAPYGTGNFTRDLFQARIAVPGLAHPVDVFSTHLKATTSDPQSDADKRGAEAQAISNFLANVYLVTNQGAPYLLTGDLNEDVFRPDTNRYESKLPIQTLASIPTGLLLDTPVNPVTTQDFTLSIQGTLNVRFDYVMPCEWLGTNYLYSEVFRSDVLTNTPLTGLLLADSKAASDHLPVISAFRIPGQVTPLVVSGDYKLLSWETMPGERYRILSSVELQTPLAEWTAEETNYLATGYVAKVSLVSTSSSRFYRIERLQ